MSDADPAAVVVGTVPVVERMIAKHAAVWGEGEEAVWAWERWWVEDCVSSKEATRRR